MRPGTVASRRMRALARTGPVVVALCVLALLLGWYTKAHCLADGGWSGGEQYSSWCYSDVLPLYAGRGLDRGAVPYFGQTSVEDTVEYPLLTGAQMFVAARTLAATVAAGVPVLGTGGVGFYHVTSVINGLAALGVLILLAAAGLPRRRLLWWALAPTMVVYVTLNWDAVPALCMVGAIVLHLRQRNLSSGLVAGVGIAAKLTPGVVVPFIALGLVAQRRWREAALHVGAALGVALLMNLPAALLSTEGWLRFFELNRERPADFDSLWYVAQEIRGTSFDVPTLNTASGLLVLLGWGVIVAVGTRRRPPEAWWALALPALIWFLLANKVYSPQYSLWLVPLMALTLRRFAPFAAFCVADLMVFAVRFPFFGNFDEAVTQAPSYQLFAVTLLVRAAVLGWILVESTLDHDPRLTTEDDRTDEDAGTSEVPTGVPAAAPG